MTYITQMHEGSRQKKRFRDLYSTGNSQLRFAPVDACFLYKFHRVWGQLNPSIFSTHLRLLLEVR